MTVIEQATMHAIQNMPKALNEIATHIAKQNELLEKQNELLDQLVNLKATEVHGK